MVSLGSKHSSLSKKKMSITKRLRQRPVLLRFWDKVNKNGPIHPTHGQCWQWTASLYTGGIGYGQFHGRRDFRETVAHRISWVIAYGELSKETLVLHKCDNPKCVNPDHLFLGDYKDNMEDMRAKGRDNPPKGEEHHWSKLTEDDIKQIRHLHAVKNLGYKKINRLFPFVSVMTIARAIRRESWKHI